LRFAQAQRQGEPLGPSWAAFYGNWTTSGTMDARIGRT